MVESQYAMNPITDKLDSRNTNIFREVFSFTQKSMSWVISLQASGNKPGWEEDWNQRALAESLAL